MAIKVPNTGPRYTQIFWMYITIFFLNGQCLTQYPVTVEYWFIPQSQRPVIIDIIFVPLNILFWLVELALPFLITRLHNKAAP
jgi:hypothetical protein